jgi:hypothetical protein
MSSRFHHPLRSQASLSDRLSAIVAIRTCIFRNYHGTTLHIRHPRLTLSHQRKEVRRSRDDRKMTLQDPPLFQHPNGRKLARACDPTALSGNRKSPLKRDCAHCWRNLPLRASPEDGRLFRNAPRLRMHGSPAYAGCVHRQRFRSDNLVYVYIYIYIYIYIYTYIYIYIYIYIQSLGSSIAALARGGCAMLLGNREGRDDDCS